MRSKDGPHAATNAMKNQCAVSTPSLATKIPHHGSSAMKTIENIEDQCGKSWHCNAGIKSHVGCNLRRHRGARHSNLCHNGQDMSSARRPQLFATPR